MSQGEPSKNPATNIVAIRAVHFINLILAEILSSALGCSAPKVIELWQSAINLGDNMSYSLLFDDVSAFVAARG